MLKIDVAAGEVHVHRTDLLLPGYIPLELSRTYRSGSSRSGLLGYGWNFNYEVFIDLEQAESEDDEDRLLLHDQAGDTVAFSMVPEGEQTKNEDAGLTLENQQDMFVVYARPDLKQFFSKDQGGQRFDLSRIEDRNGNVIELVYDPDGRLLGLLDTLDRRITFNYSRDRIASIQVAPPEQPLSTTEVMAYRYSRSGDLVAATDAAGHSFRFDYQDRLLVTAENRLGGQYHAQYGEDRRCVRAWQGDGSQARVFENCQQRCAVRVRDSYGHQKIYKYAPVDPTKEAVQATVLEEVDPNAESICFNYDARFHPIGRMKGGGIDHYQVTNYQSDSNLLHIEGGETVTTFFFDERGGVEKMLDAMQKEWLVESDSGANAVKLKSPLGSEWTFPRGGRGAVTEVESPEGRKASLTRSEDGRRLVVEDKEGLLYEHHYDLFGRLVERVDALQRRQQRRYDGAGNLTSIVFGEGCLVTYEYDAENNVTVLTDPAGQRVRFGYDAFGRLIEGTRPDGSRTKFAYDREGRLAEIENANGQKAHYSRDLEGRVVHFVSFDGSEEHYEYQDAGSKVTAKSGPGSIVREFNHASRLVKEECGDGMSREFTYDLNGQLTAVEIKEQPELPVAEYISQVTGKIYDIFDEEKGGDPQQTVDEMTGKMAERENLEGKIAFDYDDDGRLIAEDQSGAKIFYSYDRDGNCISIQDYEIWPDDDPLKELEALGAEDKNGRLIRLSYDGRNRLVEAVDREEFRYHFSYDEVDRLTEIAMPCGLLQTFEYDIRNRVTQRCIVDAEDQVANQRSYVYDALDKLVRIEDSETGVTSYTRDAMGRVVRVSRAQGSDEEYTYDACGNIEHSSLLGAHRYGPEGRLEQAGEVSYPYGAGGLAAGRETPDGKWAYDFDSLGQLSAVTGVYGQTWKFQYDGLGRRKSKKKGSDQTTWLWSGDQVFAEKGKLAVEYLVLGGLLLGCRRGEDYFSFGLDPDGSPAELFDRHGKPVWQVKAKPELGSWQIKSNGVNVPLVAPDGTYEDEEIGLRYTRFRYYNPDTGCYLSPNPLGLAGGLNLYVGEALFGVVQPRSFGLARPLDGRVQSPLQASDKTPWGLYSNKSGAWSRLQRQGLEWDHRGLPGPMDLQLHDHRLARVEAGPQKGTGTFMPEGQVAGITYSHDFVLEEPASVGVWQIVHHPANFSAGRALAGQFQIVKRAGIAPGDIAHLYFV